jgi:hypothetical protein
MQQNEIQVMGHKEWVMGFVETLVDFNLSDLCPLTSNLSPITYNP